MGQIKVTACGDIKGLCVVEPKVFGDTRGYFMETYNEKDFFEAGIRVNFVQDNQSGSCFGVLRGLHFQREYPQDKLVRVVSGEVFDVAVDLREGSDTFGKWHGVILSSENKKQFFIPRGFRNMRNLHINVRISIIRMMRAGLLLTLPKSGLNGRFLMEWTLSCLKRIRTGEAYPIMFRERGRHEKRFFLFACGYFS